MSDSATPWTAARQASLSITILNLNPVKSNIQALLQECWALEKHLLL